MKRLFNIAILLFLVTSCSKDDDANPQAGTPEDNIPADQKYIDRIDRWENNILFDYDANKKVQYIYFGLDNAYTVTYEGDRIKNIRLNSNVHGSYDYQFGYNDSGLAGYFTYTTGDHQLVNYMPLIYNATTKSYNDWLYLYDDGSIRRVVAGGLDRTLIYDTGKKGAFFNMDQKLILYLMFVNRNVVLWPAYIGRYPCKEVVQQQGVLEMQNTFDSQGFIATSHMDSTLNNLNCTYTYTQL